MYYAMIIFLHRLYVSNGHLQSASASVARDAFLICASAAMDVDQMLRLYRRHFCLQTAPYFISYATYVSATTYVRMASQSSPGSVAHKCLRNSLEMLEEQQTRCYALRRTLQILLDLAGRLKVDVGGFSVLGSSGHQMDDERRVRNLDLLARPESGPCPHDQDSATQNIATSQEVRGTFVGSDPMLVDIDIDEIIKSFDLASKEPFEPAPLPNQDEFNRSASSMSDPRQAAGNSDLEGSSSMYGALSVDDGFFQGQDTLLFPDSLFGLDFDASWLPSSSN